MMNYFAKWSLCAVAVLALSTVNQHAGAADKTIVDTAVDAGSFNTLTQALQAAGLIDALQGKGPFTVFAPTDEAFAKLPPEQVAALLKPENKETLAGILTFHVVPGKVLAKDVVKIQGAVTLNGQRADVVIKDGKVSIDGANVVKTDIKCSNGVIHVIDRVILPASEDLAKTATKAGNFQTLLAAADAAGLTEALSGKGPLTVFAPTNDAFAKLPAGTVETLLKPENRGKLAEILKYHVVAGRVYSEQALEAKKADTLANQKISISVKDGTARVNNAKLISTDIDASNGVIHVIDAVLLPTEKQSHSDTPSCEKKVSHHSSCNGDVTTVRVYRNHH